MTVPVEGATGPDDYPFREGVSLHRIISIGQKASADPDQAPERRRLQWEQVLALVT